MMIFTVIMLRNNEIFNVICKKAAVSDNKTVKLFLKVLLVHLKCNLGLNKGRGPHLQCYST